MVHPAGDFYSVNIQTHETLVRIKVQCGSQVEA